MNGKDAAPPQVRSTKSFTMTSGQCMDDVLEDSSRWQEDTESDSDKADSVSQKRGVGLKAKPVDARLHGKLKKKALQERRAERNKKAQDFDAIMETTAEEEGRLNIRTIEDLSKEGGGDGLLKKGDRFLCRQEVLVRIAEDNELQQRMYSTHSSKTGGAVKDGVISPEIVRKKTCHALAGGRRPTGSLAFTTSSTPSS